MRNYNFKEYKLPTTDEIWLEEIYKSNLLGINKRDIKVRLRNVLPKHYNPDNIDKRFINNDRLTLLGIWYLDNNNPIMLKVEKVIKEIQNILDLDSSISSFDIKLICELTNLSENEIKYIFQILLDLELLSGSSTIQGEIFPCQVSFSENHSGFDKVLYFNNIYETMEEFFNENKPYDHDKLHSKNIEESKKVNGVEIDKYVDLGRITDLEKIKKENYDLSRLIQLCKELNDATLKKSFLSIAMITRTIINHIPPIFHCDNFAEVVNNYNWGKSYKDLMIRLEKSLKNIADSHLHKQITNVEDLPTFQQVNFVAEIDVLISEIIQILKGKEVNLSKIKTKISSRIAKGDNESERYSLKLVNGAYFFKEPLKDRPDGPYCTRCYDVDNKLVILTSLRPPFDDVAKYQCQNCKGLF